MHAREQPVLASECGRGGAPTASGNRRCVASALAHRSQRSGACTAAFPRLDRRCIAVRGPGKVDERLGIREGKRGSRNCNKQERRKRLNSRNRVARAGGGGRGGRRGRKARAATATLRGSSATCKRELGRQVAAARPPQRVAGQQRGNVAADLLAASPVAANDATTTRPTGNAAGRMLSGGSAARLCFELSVPTAERPRGLCPAHVQC